MNGKVLSIGGLLIAVVALLAVNIVGPKMLKSSRIDLTEGQLFTLSDGTREILSELDEPITLRFYLSRRQVTALPGIKSYADRVEELLEQYRREAGQRITLIKLDPEPFSDEEDRAVAYGLRGVPLDEGDNTLYFGLVGTGSTGQEQVIPFFTVNRERFLEYDVSRLVYSLAHPKPPVVGLLSTLSINGPTPQAMMQGMNTPPWMVMEQVNQLFSVLPVETTAEEIPEEVDVLLVVHPKSLSDKTLYAIDQFVMGGGRVLMFVDPLAEVDQVAGQRMMGMMMPGKTSNPEKLLASWGVKLITETVVGDLANAVRVQTQRGGRMITIDYPVWMSVAGPALNATDLVTANLENLALGTPGELTPIPGATTSFTPLVQSSDQAMAIVTAKVDQAPDPEAIMREYKPGGKSMVLAARITGAVNSAFPNGPPKDKEQHGEGATNESVPDTSKETDSSADNAPAHRAQSDGDINVVLVADADMLHDRFWVRVQDLMGSRIAVPTAGNGSFVINALDHLTGSSSLIAVRSKGSFVRPFERIDTLRRDAELKFREKESQLIAQLDETENRLRALESEKQGDDKVVFNEAQRQELIKFRKERLQIRKELRDVRLSLRRNIESLYSKLRFTNIALVPILIAVGGLVVAFVRMQRRRRSIRAAMG